MCEAAQRRDRNAAPDYCCDIKTHAYAQKARYGKLLKLHGSLNWAFVPAVRGLTSV